MLATDAPDADFRNPFWVAVSVVGISSAMRSCASPRFSRRHAEAQPGPPPLFGPVGAIWWAKADSLRQTRNFYMPDHTGWEIPWERAVDIDTDDDWRMAELLMERQIQDAVAR